MRTKSLRVCVLLATFLFKVALATAQTVTVDLVPSDFGPYVSGQVVTVDVNLSLTGAGGGKLLRLVQLDLNDSDAALLAGASYPSIGGAPFGFWDFTSLASCPGVCGSGHFVGSIPSGPNPNIGTAIYVGFQQNSKYQLFMPDGIPLRIGVIELTMPSESGSYTLDVLGTGPAPEAGAMVLWGFGFVPGDDEFRVTVADILGGTLTFVIEYGACCHLDESCSLGFEADCDGKWTLNGTCTSDTCGPALALDYSRVLFGEPTTLSLFAKSIETDTGTVLINGIDSQEPNTPFTWNWGDGQTTDGFFPQGHTYDDTTRNYVVTVTSHYSNNESDSQPIAIRFVVPDVNPEPMPLEVGVTLPITTPVLTSQWLPYMAPTTLVPFADADFGVVPRSTIEYILTVAAGIQRDFVNWDFVQFEDGFQQTVWKDNTLTGGMYSLWFTFPVALGASAGTVQGTIEYSSFMHELAHNVTLNTPANFHFGGRIDGSANTIYSESMAQILQHATAHELVNNAAHYGIGDGLAFDIGMSAKASVGIVRDAFDTYISEGTNFRSWNDPATPNDETFDTFMTVAYKFFEHAELAGQGYRIPVKRMLYLLQLFDRDMADRFDQHNDNPEADAFRATLVVAAISHAFSDDLRVEFANLGFPIDDDTYDELMARVAQQPIPVGRLIEDFDQKGVAGFDPKFNHMLTRPLSPEFKPSWQIEKQACGDGSLALTLAPALDWITFDLPWGYYVDWAGVTLIGGGGNAFGIVFGSAGSDGFYTDEECVPKRFEAGGLGEITHIELLAIEAYFDDVTINVVRLECESPDLSAIDLLPGCMAGPERRPTPDSPIGPTACQCEFDANRDGDVDLRDIAAAMLNR